ncbi:hypothetical protein LTR37_006933 [Vermiconidia calcicola]|uniref:Uncharacterized protein n=1 Tax=Vermiconidia calcicola TaxID=1690605 RepID=A0ACC3NG17_9PEZI|nr:hypothetical protein LTR37_006933 [Vermiconidia calcicola]
MAPSLPQRSGRLFLLFSILAVLIYTYLTFSQPAARTAHARRDLGTSSSPVTATSSINSEYNSGYDSTTSSSNASSQPSHRLFPRVVSTPEEVKADWEACSRKGCELYQLLQAETAAASKWTDWDDLKNYGYQRTENFNIKENPYVADALYRPVSGGGCGAPEEIGPPQCMVKQDHIRDYTEATYTNKEGEEESYERTFAYYENNFYPDQGIIVATDNFGPVQRLKAVGKTLEGEIVPLRQWSDIVFLEWQHQTTAGQQRRGIKFVVHSNIINTRTKNVIFKALEDDGDSPIPPAFPPGKEYPMDSKQGKAILGTPNGNGVAWFLIQHKAELGHKTIESVVVFDNSLYEDQRETNDREHSTPSLMFRIEDWTSADYISWGSDPDADDSDEDMDVDDSDEDMDADDSGEVVWEAPLE